MRVLGINAVFHDPAAALVVDGEIVAAAEEERFSRRKHGKNPVPFSTWEVPELSAAWCLAAAGITAADLDAVAYSYDPSLAPPVPADIVADGWEGLRTLYAQRAPLFLRTALPGLDPAIVRFVPHHIAHAASAALAAPYPQSSVLVLDGRGERASHLAGRSDGGHLEVLRTQELPHSLGVLYEEVTEHLGFRRSSDEYKVMALASYAEPAFLPEFRELVTATGDGGSRSRRSTGGTFTKKVDAGAPWTQEHAELARVGPDPARGGAARAGDLAAPADRRPHADHGRRASRSTASPTPAAPRGPFDDIWVQPAAGDAGHGARRGAARRPRWATRSSRCTRPRSAAGWSDEELEAWLVNAAVPVRAAGRRRRGGRRGARRQRGGRVVPGPQRVRPARARAPQPARAPRRGRQPRADEQHQGARAVPADRADGARRAGRRDLLRRADPQPVHAVHARRARRVA
jgi:carbamoyltransferase